MSYNDYPIFVPFIATNSQTFTKVVTSVYNSEDDSAMECGIYDCDSDGAPDAKIAVWSIPCTSNGDSVLTLSSSISFTEGQRYWFFYRNDPAATGNTSKPTAYELCMQPIAFQDNTLPWLNVYFYISTGAMPNNVSQGLLASAYREDIPKVVLQL